MTSDTHAVTTDGRLSDPAPSGTTHWSLLPDMTEEGRQLLKWIAVVAMVADHFNHFLLGGEEHWIYAIGRICMPIFSLMLGWNLATYAHVSPGLYARTSGRLLLAALLSTPFTAAMTPSVLPWWPLNVVWPLNVMWTLLAGCLCCWALEQQLHKPKGAMLLMPTGLLFLGALPEYFWSGILCVVAGWCVVRHPGRRAQLLIFASTATLPLLPWLGTDLPLYTHFTGLLAFPLMHLLKDVRIQTPRAKWFFYAFYPCHLALLLCIR